MNETVNKFLLARGKFMPEMYLRHSGFSWSISKRYGGTETFCPKGHISVWGCLSPGAMKHFEPKIYKDSYITLYAKLIYIFWPKKSDNVLSQNVSIPPYCILYITVYCILHIVYYRRTLFQPHIKNRFYIFFLIFLHVRIPSSLGMPRYWN